MNEKNFMQSLDSMPSTETLKAIIVLRSDDTEMPALDIYDFPSRIAYRKALIERSERRGKELFAKCRKDVEAAGVLILKEIYLFGSAIVEGNPQDIKRLGSLDCVKEVLENQETFVLLEEEEH